MPHPGPLELGRGVVVLDGQPPPAPWAGAPTVVIDEAAVDDPEQVVGSLHRAWAARAPVVVELAVDPSVFRTPRAHPGEPWCVGAGFTAWHDRLHFLVWANTYDARGERGADPAWWWAAKAVRAGADRLAVEGEPGDVVLADGTPAWIDGGPRAPLPVPLAGAGVIHRESVEVGSLALQPPPRRPSAVLAPDQLAAVAHGAGPARIIAPAGSGKTRVLTERYRHLLADRGYEPGTALALAYNRKAAHEMASRLPGLGARIQTLNAWGYALLSRYLGRRPTVLDEREVRTIVERLVPQQRRRVNTDPIAPYLDGLSLIRLGLRDPDEVEASLDDVTGLAAAYEPYRAELRRRGAIDFDEQVYATLEALLGDGAFRQAVQADHRHLLVDELQDLTPAHVLLVRLVSAPAFDVFGVGDDDQTIYGHVGSDPRFLVDYTDFFPGAHAHALEVNYRCPAPVTEAAATLLGYNQRRVEKVITPGPGVERARAALEVRTHAADAGAAAVVEAVAGWLADASHAESPDAQPATAAPPAGTSDRAGLVGVPAAPPTAEVAVLARVQSLLLGPHVALTEAGIPIDSILDEGVLGRLGVRAALAYLRLATAPAAIAGADLVEVHRRPSRGLPQWATKWLGNCRSLADLRQAAARVGDPKVGAKLDDLAGDLDRLAALAQRRASTRDLLTAVRDDIGLGSAMTLLDSSGGAAGSHLDDLEALLQVADLHPDPGSFEGWLRAAFHRERVDGGVTLSTVHRVKGREWDRVAVFGVTEGIVPHRLSADIEEERRILHVAITRGRRRVLVLGDRSRPSPLLAELDGSAPRQRVLQPAEPEPAPKRPARAEPTSHPAEIGLELTVLGGYEGEIAALDDGGVQLRLEGGRSMFVRFGERVRIDGQQVALGAPPSPVREAAAAALRAWRTRQAAAQGVPAYVVLSDKHLDGIAERHPTTLAGLRACPGIGPAKLESYGDEILALLAEVAAP